MYQLFGSDFEDDIFYKNEFESANYIQDEDRFTSFDNRSNPAEDGINSVDACSNGEVEGGPETGKLYESIDSLFDTYQEYAKRKGFSIVKRILRKGGEVDYKYVLLVCNRAEKSHAQKSSKRIYCQARINAIKKVDGTWLVSKMVSEHNRELDPNFSILMPAHRNLSIHMKRQLEVNGISGIRPCKNVRLCEVQCGGPQNLGCLPKDCRNFIKSRRLLRLDDGDVEAIRNNRIKGEVVQIVRLFE